MRARQFTHLALRLLAAYYIIQTLAAIPTVVIAVTAGVAAADVSDDTTGTILAAALTIALQGAVGLILWFRTSWCVDRIFGVPPEPADRQAAYEADGAAGPSASDAVAEDDRPAAYIDEPDRLLAIEDIQATAFSIMGIWILAGAIPDLIRIVYLWFDTSDLTDTSLKMYDMFMGVPSVHLWSLVARIIIGLVLFLKSWGVVAFWSRVSAPGVRPADEDA